MLYGRANLTAVSLGIHQVILEETTAFYAERQRCGAPLDELGPVKLKLGQMQSRLLTARLTDYHAVHLLDCGLPSDAEMMNAKLVNVEYAFRLIGRDMTQTIEDQERQDRVNTGNRPLDPRTSTHHDSPDHPA